MKIKHYPGKAVINDPAWLEMDIPNSTRGRQYEANWEDAQKSLSNNSSASNSWDKYSYKSMDGTISSRLGQYQSMLDDIKKDNEDIYAIPNKLVKSGKDSVKLKYHSEKCLSRINSKSKKDMEEEIAKYFLPSQAKVQRERSFKVEEKEAPKPKPRKKLPTAEQDREKFKVVIDDLQKHIKKSVRFDEISTEITGTAMDNYVDGDDEDEETGEKLRVITNPLHEIEDKRDDLSDSEEIQERVSTWIDDQNKYLIAVDGEEAKKDVQTNLKRNDSGYYEHSEKPRQRLPPKNIYPSSSSSSSESVAEERVYTKTSSSSTDDSEFSEVYSLYKNGSSPKRVAVVNSQPKLRDRTKNPSPPALRRGGRDSSDFLIPRPKLIVPVHTYAVRKRRTGNILSECYDSDCNNSLGDFETSKADTGL